LLEDLQMATFPRPYALLVYKPAEEKRILYSIIYPPRVLENIYCMNAKPPQISEYGVRRFPRLERASKVYSEISLIQPQDQDSEVVGSNKASGVRNSSLKMHRAQISLSGTTMPIIAQQYQITVYDNKFIDYISGALGCRIHDIGCSIINCTLNSLSSLIYWLGDMPRNGY
jgi:hypothetical protein